MKEIKFRAWDTKHKMMIDHSIHIWNNPNEFRAFNDTFIEHVKEVIPLQYIGLKDKNGEEIYEEYRLYDGAGIYRNVHFVINRAAYYAGELRLTKALASKLEVASNKYEYPDIADYLRRNPIQPEE